MRAFGEIGEILAQHNQGIRENYGITIPGDLVWEMSRYPQVMLISRWGWKSP